MHPAQRPEQPERAEPVQEEDPAHPESSLAEHNSLLVRLARVQGSVVRHSGLSGVLDGIVDAARELTGDDAATLRIVEESDPRSMRLAASCGLSEARREEEYVSAAEGLSGRALTGRTLLVEEDYQHAEGANPHLLRQGIRAAMAAPLIDDGETIGSLLVATRAHGRRFSGIERQVFSSFAHFASLALGGATRVERAIQESLQDSVTGLPNRALLHDRLEHALARAGRANGQVAVLFVDLDGFKAVNDSLGHARGDELLAAVARRLEGGIRAADTLARFGGDEFVVLLEDVTDIDVEAAAKRLLALLDEPFTLAGRRIGLSASIGISVGWRDADELLHSADLALYRAKARGKGGFELFEPQMHTAVVERMALESELSRALKRDQIELRYQPIVDLRSGEIAAVEALARWRHPERGLLPADEFIFVAEEMRISLPIERMVLTEASRQAASWRGHPGCSDLAISVNLSTAQAGDEQLVQDVEEAVAETGLEPESLILELPEAAFMEHADAIAERLHELKSLGVRIAVDDFGTGFSSLQHLHRFPIDMLKIAKSFTSGVCGRRGDSTLARAIVDLGDSFRFQVVAEGIEQEDQLDCLLEMGCDLGQGFYFARPMPAGELAEVLESWHPDVARAGL